MKRLQTDVCTAPSGQHARLTAAENTRPEALASGRQIYDDVFSRASHSPSR